MRKTHHLEQGSDAWHAHRATPGMINASEVAAIMGIDPKTSRSELLRMKATGGEKEFSDYVRKRVIDKGHENEALARPYAEELIGDDLSALVMTDTIDGILFSASLDGITQDHSITFEHKSFSMVLADSLDAGVIPPAYLPQMEVGLMVSGARRCLFMASKNGDAETARHLWFDSNPNLRKLIIAACKQFQIDLENYQHVEAKPAPVAATIEALPALMIQVEGKVLATNLDQFKASAQAFIDNINTDLQTDQDFADADKMVKFLKDAEARLALEKQRVLAQTASIDELFRTIDAISEQMKCNRLRLDKLVAAEKQNRKQEIIADAIKEVNAHAEKLNTRLGEKWMPQPTIAPIVEAVRGLKTIESIREKARNAARNMMFEANRIADLISANREAVPDHLRYLFPDFALICTKSEEDFGNLISARVIEEQRRKDIDRNKTQEEAERVKAQYANDQREKADAGVGLSPDGRAQPVAASIPPTRNATAAPIIVEGHFDEARANTIVDNFLKLLSDSPAEKKVLRPRLVMFAKYQAACEAQVMV